MPCKYLLLLVLYMAYFLSSPVTIKIVPFRDLLTIRWVEIWMVFRTMLDTEEMLCLLIKQWSLFIIITCSVFSEPSNTWKKIFSFPSLLNENSAQYNQGGHCFLCPKTFYINGTHLNLFFFFLSPSTEAWHTPRIAETIEIFWDYLNSEQKE